MKTAPFSWSLALMMVSASFLLAADPATPAEFTALDTNGDGVLSGLEKSAKVEGFDQDGDGEIALAEYRSGVAKRDRSNSAAGASFDLKAGEAKFAGLDGNSDDRLSGTEIKGVERYDSDGDGRISREEFLGGLSKEQMKEQPSGIGEPWSGEEPSIVVASGTKPFEVSPGTVVRMLGQGIAGSEITADVRGPGKLLRKAYVAQMIDGEIPIGGETVEFEVTPTGPGEVVVVITVDYPTGSPPKKTTYKFGLSADEGGSAAVAPADDRKQILGTWTIVSILDGGEIVPKEAHAGSYIEITGDKLRVVSPERVKESSYILDPAKSPKWLDLTTGASKKRSLGIYELSGDELKISVNDGSKDAPRADGYEWEPNSPNAQVMVLKRRVP